MNAQLNLAAERFWKRLNELIPYLDNQLVSQERILLAKEGKNFYPIEGWSKEQDLKELSCFKPTSSRRLVVAVDSSLIAIAHLPSSKAYAIRVGIAMAEEKEVLCYLRLGPVFVIAPNSSSNLADRILEESLRMRAEVTALISLGSVLYDSILLMDGSPLASYTHNGPKEIWDELLQACRDRKNDLLGVSKTSLITPVPLMDALLKSKEVPCFLKLEASNNLHGGISLLCKFSRLGHAYRVDIPLDGASRAKMVLGDLVSNDKLTRGYPSTLRLAHYLSVISEADLLKLKVLATKRSLGVLSPLDLRREALGLFLGPFGLGKVA